MPQLPDGTGRQVQIAGRDLENVALAYAQHVYRQQGATVDRTIAITGGWQTSAESTYVQASRARNGTDWYIARDELGTLGHDDRHIDKLTAHMRNNRSQTPSLACGVVEIETPERALMRAPTHSRLLTGDRDRGHDRGR